MPSRQLTLRKKGSIVSCKRWISARTLGEAVDRDASKQVTQLLANWGQGNLEARDALMPLVYNELRQLAASYLRRERSDHTLQPTALVHEVYLRLVQQDNVNWQNRHHFLERQPT